MEILDSPQKDVIFLDYLFINIDIFCLCNMLFCLFLCLTLLLPSKKVIIVAYYNCMIDVH